MTHKKDTEIQSCYHIKDIINVSENVKLLCILFHHALTGSDTTSSIHMFKKTSMLSKIKSSKKLRDIADQFYLEDMPVDVIGNVTIHFFDLLNSPSNTLQQLSDDDKDPLRWGSIIKNKMFTPIMTDNEAGLPDLLKIVHCSCKGSCRKSYSCIPAGRQD